ncbi:MAE_28990/MAE_18760 family HEPN-like nuclease [Castellaniella sp.]|uniref:MAE_28990/MAE_18760 family HEPN-like nuclease n=1 Tax=Castellaniella sp. TaxID=1955812 RepID=UPI003A932C1A
MTPEDAQNLREQIYFSRDKECLATLTRIRALVEEKTSDPEMLRLMATPMLYSVWERVFSLCTSTCLRVIENEYERAAECPASARAFWLRKASFFKSFVSSVRDLMELEREDSVFQQSSGFKKKINKGAFNLSIEVLSRLDEWHQNPLSHKSGCEDLVITYSNVNDSVVATNAEAIGLVALDAYKSLDLTKLGALVGIRNGIGHGASLIPPGPRELSELIDYSENLVTQYVNITTEWIDFYTEE